MDVTLKINGRDFSTRLSTYRVEQEITYPDVITTMDGTEYTGRKFIRDIVVFSLLPFDDETASEDFAVLSSGGLEVDYTDPSAAEALKQYRKMRLDSSLSATFGLRSVDGNRYYKGGEITLRAINAD